MKCSKCNNEIEEGSAFCVFCGAKVEEEPKVSEEVVQESEVKDQTQNVAEEPVVETKEEVKAEEKVEKEEVKATVQDTTADKGAENKKRHSVITIAILAVAAIVVLLITLLTVALCSKGPERLYKDVIKSAITELYSGEAITATNANINASVELSTDISDLKDQLDGIKVATNVQYDFNEKQALLGVNLDKKTDNYLSAKAMVDLAKNEVYVSESNLFDKVIKAEIPEEVRTQIKEYLGEDENLAVDKRVGKTIAKKISAAVNNSLNKEIFAREKVVVNLNGKDKKVKDNTLTLTAEEMKEVVENIVNTLKMDNEFLECYEDRDEIIDSLDRIESGCEDLEDSEEKITIHYYTSGIANDFVGVVFVISEDEYNEKIIEVVKTSKTVYEINLKETSYGSTETIETIIITVNKANKNEKDITIAMDFEDVGNIKLNIVTSQQYNKGIEALDTANAVNYEELTEEDYGKIYENLMSSKLNELLSTYMGDFEETLNPDSDDTSDDRDVPAGINLKKGQSFVESYDDDVIVFDVPTSFEEEYAGLSYQRFSKEDKTKETAYIDVDCNWDTLEEYEESIDSNTEYYTEEDGYTNVKVSDREEVKVGDNTFYTKTFQYTYKSGSYSYTQKQVYYYMPITDEYVYSVEIDDADEIVTTKEIEKLLTIDVTLHK